tara:strand:- start:3236 stop:3598 length:363 start_codon:yes stop_codon:yes gene_type:complete
MIPQNDTEHLFLDDRETGFENTSTNPFRCRDRDAENFAALEECVYLDDSAAPKGDEVVSKGCMDVLALNYDPTAFSDDGGCFYEDPTKDGDDGEIYGFKPKDIAIALGAGVLLYLAIIKK